MSILSESIQALEWLCRKTMPHPHFAQVGQRQFDWSFINKAIMHLLDVPYFLKTTGFTSYLSHITAQWRPLIEVKVA